MALARKRPIPWALTKYYIYDPGVKDELGGFKVKRDGADAFVMLTKEQAAYFLPLGTVGLKTLKELNEMERKNVHEVLGGRVPLEPDARGTKPRKYSAKQDIYTTAKHLVQGRHPVTGQLSRDVSAAERLGAKPSQAKFTAHEGLSKDEVRGGRIRHGR